MVKRHGFPQQLHLRKVCSWILLFCFTTFFTFFTFSISSSALEKGPDEVDLPLTEKLKKYYRIAIRAHFNAQEEPSIGPKTPMEVYTAFYNQNEHTTTIDGLVRVRQEDSRKFVWISCYAFWKEVGSDGVPTAKSYVGEVSCNEYEN